MGYIASIHIPSNKMSANYESLVLLLLEEHRHLEMMNLNKNSTCTIAIYHYSYYSRPLIIRTPLAKQIFPHAG